MSVYVNSEMACARKDSLSIEDAREISTCACCKKTSKDPRFLPCGHTCNFRCIKRNRPVMTCPLCNRRHVFEENSNLSKNVFVSDISLFIRLQDVCFITKDFPVCQDHKEKLLEYCEVCDFGMCQRCKKTHDRIPETKKHKVFQAAEFKNFPVAETVHISNFKTSELCKRHSCRLFKWCLDCQLPVCTLCCPDCDNTLSLSDHVKAVEDKLSRMESKLAETDNIVRDQLSRINAARKEIKTVAKSEYTRELTKSSEDKRKCEFLLNLMSYLIRLIRALLSIGKDLHKCQSLRHVEQQWQIITDWGDILLHCYRSSDDSNKSHRSLDSWSSLESSVSSCPESYQNVPREEVIFFTEEDDGLYKNEAIYDEVQERRIDWRTKGTKTKQGGQTEGKADARLQKHDIINKINQFDTETRITGMILVDDIIIIASGSGKQCSGFDINGKHQWDITEKLTKPFDLATTITDQGKRHVYISDPGSDSASRKGVIHIFEQKENKRYRHLKRHDGISAQPRGITIYSNRLYVCDIFEKVILEFDIESRNSLKPIKRYGDGFLFEPLYANVHIICERVKILVSDHKRGLKTIVKGEDANDQPGWNINDEKRFAPCKSCAGKDQGVVFVGNFTGKKIHTINFQPRQIIHQDFLLDELCGSPVALILDDIGRLLVGCKDGIIVVLYTSYLEKNAPMYKNI